MPVHKPRWNGDAISRQLRNYDRVPFLDLLSILIERFPTPEALSEFAEKNPDRYIFAMVQLAKIAGYSDRQELIVDLMQNVGSMSDLELAEHLRRLMQQAPTLIDAKPLDDAGSKKDGSS